MEQQIEDYKNEMEQLKSQLIKKTNEIKQITEKINQIKLFFDNVYENKKTINNNETKTT
jgi:hypothetical protein